MIITVRYKNAHLPVYHETDIDGCPVYSIEIEDIQEATGSDGIMELGKLMALARNTKTEAHHFHKTLEQQTNTNIHRNRHILHLKNGVDWVFTGRNWLFNTHKKTYDYSSVEEFHRNFYKWHCNG